MDSLPDVFSKLPIGLQWAIAVVLALSAIGFPLSTIGRWLWRVRMFLTKDDRTRQWELEIESTIDVKQHNEETIFQHRFKTHRKVAAIRLEIIEPTLEPRNNKGYSPAWAIYSIDFKVYRLFGCLWEGGL